MGMGRKDLMPQSDGVRRSSEAWTAALRDLNRLLGILHELSAAPDVATRLDAGLSTPSERRAALLMLGLLDTRHTVASVDLVVAASESHRDARLARELLGRLSRRDLQDLVPPVVFSRLDDADDDTYRRLAELLAYLGLHRALEELCELALASDDPGIREVAADFGG